LHCANSSGPLGFAAAPCSTPALPSLTFPTPSLEPGELTAQTQAVLDALSVLDEPEQAVMAFRLDHFPVAVIADTLGITEQQVRDVTRKARTKLRRDLATAKTPERRTPA
jgi:DNA-directed RNA polymerase specialized sigma24 family protein